MDNVQNWDSCTAYISFYLKLGDHCKFINGEKCLRTNVMNNFHKTFFPYTSKLNTSTEYVKKKIFQEP
jgi:hypothetical protein